jgi:SPP1 gp7 family putative phage head morphogenesis protein
MVFAVRRFDARPKRPARVPRNSARRAGALHLPVQVERFLVTQMARLSRAFASSVRSILMPHVKHFARKPAERTDASGDKSAKGLANQVKAAADRVFSANTLRGVTDRAARQLDAHSKSQFRQLGIKVDKEPDLKWLQKGWAKDYADRINGITEEQAEKFEEILSTGSKREATSIAKDIEHQLGVTESRATFLARDAIGTLNSKVSRHRMRAARIKFYIWTTVGDDRVRKRHDELDGTVFEIDSDGDPEEGHPGEPPQCRCVQYPMPPDDDEKDALEEEDEAPEEPTPDEEEEPAKDDEDERDS